MSKITWGFLGSRDFVRPHRIGIVGAMDKDNAIYVQALWTVADSFSYSVTIDGNQPRNFQVHVKHPHKSFEEFLVIGRSTVKVWCRKNMHQLPDDGETEEHRMGNVNG